MVTSATAQLLSNMAIGAVVSCRRGRRVAASGGNHVMAAARQAAPWQCNAWDRWLRLAAPVPLQAAAAPAALLSRARPCGSSSSSILRPAAHRQPALGGKGAEVPYCRCPQLQKLQQSQVRVLQHSPGREMHMRMQACIQSTRACTEACDNGLLQLAAQGRRPPPAAWCRHTCLCLHRRLGRLVPRFPMACACRQGQHHEQLAQQGRCSQGTRRWGLGACPGIQLAPGPYRKAVWQGRMLHIQANPGCGACRHPRVGRSGRALSAAHHASGASWGCLAGVPTQGLLSRGPRAQGGAS